MAWPEHGLEHHFKKLGAIETAGGSSPSACGVWLSTKSRFASGQYALTDKIEEVTCERCKKTSAYRSAVRRQDRERS